MSPEDSSTVPVRAKVLLVEPSTMHVTWMNESAAEDAECALAAGSLSLAEAMPMAELLGIPTAVAEVELDGDARHLHTELVSTSKGSVSIVTSVYPLPNHTVLVVTEHAWKPRENDEARTGRRRRR